MLYQNITGKLQKNGKEESTPKTKTIYDAGYGEIFWKNFLAGLGNGLGGYSYPKDFLLKHQNAKPSPNSSPENFIIQKLLGK